MKTSPEGGRRAAVAEVLAVAAAVVGFVAALWAARGEPGMTWDEPYFFERQHDIRDWLGQVAGTPAGRGRAWSREGLERAWKFCRAVPDQHPPVPSELSGVTGVLFEGWLGPLRAYRLAAVAMFGLAGGVLFRLVRSRWGWVPALAALGGLVFNARILGDAQQVTADVPLGAFYFLAAAASLRALETGRVPWAFGLLAGLAIMCKATGVLVLLGSAAWALAYRPRGAWRLVAWSVPTIPLAMVAVNPSWWPAPIWGMARWFRAFLDYPQKVPVYYLGRIYDSRETFLPWHNTAVLTATMVPAGLLAMGAVGLGAAAWMAFRGRREPAEPGRLPDRMVAGWAAIHFATPMVLRMFPFMPAHDGLRQLVPAFFFFAALVGLGAAALLGTDPARRARRLVGSALVLAAVGSAGWETVRIHPYEMSYFNALIGGPRGARDAGMETTYFWDAADAGALGWMNANLPRGATVLIFPPPNVRTFAWEQRWGRLRPDLKFLNLDPPHSSERLGLMLGPTPCYLIFLLRQGLYVPPEPGRETVFTRLARAPARFEVAPARVGGVRLLAIFDRDDFARAMEAGQN